MLPRSVGHWVHTALLPLPYLAIFTPSFFFFSLSFFSLSPALADSPSRSHFCKLLQLSESQWCENMALWQKALEHVRAVGSLSLSLSRSYQESINTVTRTVTISTVLVLIVIELITFITQTVYSWSGIHSVCVELTVSRRWVKLEGPAMLNLKKRLKGEAK